jgi:hypothetical protein
MISSQYYPIIKMNNIVTIVICPHCKIPVIIQKLNCAIFRHGVYKTTGFQIDPHLPKNICDQLAKESAIYGCGKPFQVIFDPSGEMIAITCDYI